MIGAITAGLFSGAGAPASTNSYESISTVTVGAGGSSDVTFSSIPSTYKHLQIRATNRCSLDSGRLRFQVNGDTGANYSSHYILGVGSAVYAGGTANDTRLAGAYNNATANVFSVDIIDLLEYALSLIHI